MSLNIPSTVDDPNYRYKMPKLASRVEGRGNGIKTNIINMGEIAKALARPPDYPTKFCGHELGAQSKFEVNEGKAIINGAHETKTLQGLIDKFIMKFVLCNNCKLPETDIAFKKKMVYGNCNACGHFGKMDNEHKLANFILTHPPPESSTVKASEKKTKEERRAAKNAASAAVGGDDDHANDKSDVSKKKEKDSKEKDDKISKKSRSKSTTTTDEADDENDEFGDSEEKSDAGEEKAAGDGTTAKSKKKQKEKDKDPELLEKENLTHDCPEMLEVRDRLRVFLSSGDRSPSDFFLELRRLQVSQDFDSSLRLFVTLEALFGDALTPAALKERMPFVKTVIDSSMGCNDVCTVLEDYVHLKAASSWKSFPLLLHTLYSADAVDEEGLLSHYRNKKRVAHGSEAYLGALQRVQPFLKWLEEGDAESESDDE